MTNTLANRLASRLGWTTGGEQWRPTGCRAPTRTPSCWRPGRQCELLAVPVAARLEASTGTCRVGPGRAPGSATGRHKRIPAPDKAVVNRSHSGRRPGSLATDDKRLSARDIDVALALLFLRIHIRSIIRHFCST
ncbi:Poly(ADP-ribose) glycohydrolase [Frankliniella fusca]|uniref:Poly(ADP-ribose) glycohydrolase n=1 Tax=Frankliniella fusca TaxID=407009 RepID=A0AAE1LL17_9NEOP|nr:Poly(ADP-ribose) glycohydrolase [Frankliniella fusca]